MAILSIEGVQVHHSHGSNWCYAAVLIGKWTVFNGTNAPISGMPYLQYLGLDGGVMFSAAVGRVSEFNQKNGKIIVYLCQNNLCIHNSLFYSQVHKIRANIKSGLDSQKSSVTNHVQILQDRYYKQISLSSSLQGVGGNWHVLMEQAPIPGAQSCVPSLYIVFLTNTYISLSCTVCDNQKGIPLMGALCTSVSNSLCYITSSFPFLYIATDMLLVTVITSSLHNRRPSRWRVALIRRLEGRILNKLCPPFPQYFTLAHRWWKY